MAWSKKLPARKGGEIEIEVEEDGEISLHVEGADASSFFFSLTPNQAGDLAHALEEAIRKVEGK